MTEIENFKKFGVRNDKMVILRFCVFHRVPLYSFFALGLE